MKAAVIERAGASPVFGEFEIPAADRGQELIRVHAAALSPFSKARSIGMHYSSGSAFPAVAGVDGVGLTQNGRRVYFVLPDAPYGSLAELCPVDVRHCVELPAEVDDLTAAAIANPGMSGWAALMERAHLKPGETVLVNGATGTSGRLAVQLAKYLGAGKVIATARNAEELEEVRALGADVVIPFRLGVLHPGGTGEFEQALIDVFADGIDVVLDYLWGEPARTILIAIAKGVEDGHPVRLVHVGVASGEDSIDLPGAALRSSAVSLMGSGVKSVPLVGLLSAIRNVFHSVQPAGLAIATRTVPLAEVEQAWQTAGSKPRIVITIP